MDTKYSNQNKSFLTIGILAILILFFFRPQIVSFLNYSAHMFGGVFSTTSNSTQEASLQVIDCGVSTAPDLNNVDAYGQDKVLTCLGHSALFCEQAKGVLKDPLFPTNVEIVKNDKNMCNFKLSYDQNSTLVDITGKKLAGQYISCPTYITKGMDKNNNLTPPVFGSTKVHEDTKNQNNLGKFGGQIYSYGTLVLFMQNNLDKNKIESLGCGGPYIDSVLASYSKMGQKNL